MLKEKRNIIFKCECVQTHKPTGTARRTPGYGVKNFVGPFAFRDAHTAPTFPRLSHAAAFCPAKTQSSMLPFSAAVPRLFSASRWSRFVSCVHAQNCTQAKTIFPSRVNCDNQPTQVCVPIPISFRLPNQPVHRQHRWVGGLGIAHGCFLSACLAAFNIAPLRLAHFFPLRSYRLRQPVFVRFAGAGIAIARMAVALHPHSRAAARNPLRLSAWPGAVAAAIAATKAGHSRTPLISNFTCATNLMYALPCLLSPCLFVTASTNSFNVLLTQ